MASLKKGVIKLRFEDHDQIRSKPEFIDSILEDLDWLGVLQYEKLQIFYPEKVWTQKDRQLRYEEVLKDLVEKKLIYTCQCPRQSFYPGTCRDKNLDDKNDHSLRIKVSPEEFSFVDLRHGLLRQDPSQDCGDFVVKDRHHQFSYQFCVVLDDMDQDINLIIRGDDILPSTGRQIYLRKLLSDKKYPLTFHHSLINEPGTNEKMSKRNGSLTIREMRQLGKSPRDLFLLFI